MSETTTPGEPTCDVCLGKGYWISKEGAEIPCDFCEGSHENVGSD